MNPRILEAAETFLWSNARLLERRLFAFQFLGEPAGPVIDALSAYQNANGGFGNALEPDKRTPNSQPIDQEFALRVLDAAGFLNGDPSGMVDQVCSFLDSITTEEGGVPFVLPDVADAPRAPWWNTGENPPASINPTGSIAGLLNKNHFEHEWLGRATEYCWWAIDRMAGSGAHDYLCAVQFLETAPDRPRAKTAFTRLVEQIQAAGLIEMDPYAAGYVHKPLDWAPRPESLYRSLFKDSLIEAHLNALEEQQQPDGGWPISWPPASPAGELEYRGIVTLQALNMLKAYGRLS